MTVVFDASNARFDLWWQGLIPLAALAFTVIAFLRGARRLWRGVGIGLTILLVLLTIVLPISDHQHVRAALANGSARTVEGVVSAHERKTTRTWTGSARGVGVSSFDRYTTHVSEQFYVGRQWFWLSVGGFPSGASFTNAAEPPVPIRDGMKARVTWFEDPWYDNQTRILKFETAAESLAKGAVQPRDFAAFWQRFSVAASKGDAAGVRALTRFPFLFAGTPLDADRFDSIWMGIFPEPNRPCFASAKPLLDGDAMSVSCGVYVYVFEKGADGWKLASFTADPEAGA